jgi:serine protease AprX
VITVVSVDGSSLRSNDGGQNWEVLDVTASQNAATNIQRVLARRQLAAQAAATGATASPNPTTGVTTINYEMAQSGQVLLTVFDARGVEVLRMNEGVRQAGANSSAIDATELPNGVYYYRVTVDGANSTGGKVVVAR